MGTPTLDEQRQMAAVHCPELLKRLTKLERGQKRRLKKRTEMADAAIRRIRAEIMREVLVELAEKWRGL